MTFSKNILITGGSGFIGSHVVRLFVNKYPEYCIINADALTYAGNLLNNADIAKKTNYIFEKIDIRDSNQVEAIFQKHKISHIIHLAAESHVDRSIANPIIFLETNVIGTANLLNAARQSWKQEENHLFYHISTDEVYGALGSEGFFREDTKYDPHSPYSASKAASDHLVSAYADTYGFPAIITNCSNNYGPNHFPEKLIPLCISNIIEKNPLPIYGDGKYTRDWLFVIDHAQAIDLVFHKGKINDRYNIGGFNEWTNIDLVNLLCAKMDSILGRKNNQSASLITFVKDRPGHDKRYAIDATKINVELGWYPSVTFEQGLEKTIYWYLENPEWLTQIKTGDYKLYYQKMYQ